MEKVYEVGIIGGGPAGLVAGLYAARGGLEVVLFEKLFPGGQMLRTNEIENWPGDVDSASGYDLSERMRRQSLKFGLKLVNLEVFEILEEDGYKKVKTSNGDFYCKTLILCFGASPRKLKIPGEETLLGKGLSYCGTCDGPFFRGKDIICIGGGDTAIEEALFLSNFATKVYLVHRRETLRSKGLLLKRLLENKKIRILYSQMPLAFLGEKKLKKVLIKKIKENLEYTLNVEGAFIFVGTEPNTQLILNLVETDPSGFVIVNNKQETSLPGVFAAGDCCLKFLRQVITAASDGAIAAHAAQIYLNK